MKKSKYLNYIPDLYVNSFYDIDFKDLYEKGYRIILTDLDNTLISYKETEPSIKLITLLKSIEALGFEIIIVSNNSNGKRIKNFASIVGLKSTHFAFKPYNFGFKRALKKASRKYKTSEIVEIGDQILTDVYGSKKMGYYTILVDAIDHKTEVLITKINRKKEYGKLRKVEKYHKELYDKTLKLYKEKNL